MTSPPVRDTGPRDGFLDAVRTMALLRVVLWHALGAAALTYFVAAVPAMFFVTGSLLAKSLRRGAGRVILDRGRRILVPLWAFAAGAYSIMTVAHVVDGTAKTAVPWRDLLMWLVPFVDPHGSAWEGGYLASPLWYLRALVWLLLISPLLLKAARRSRVVTFAIPVLGLAALELLARTGSFTGSWAWRLGDLALYSIFVLLGFVHRDGGLDRIRLRGWLASAIVFGGAAAAWCITQPVPGHVVNDSHPAHLFVGFAWLSLFFAARPLIQRIATSRMGGGFIGWVNQRTMTIYLWHSTAVIVSFELLRHLGLNWFPGGWVIALLAMTACVTVIFVLAFGWIEDLANRRAPRLWPVAPRTRRRSAWAIPRPAIGVALLGATVLGATATATADPGRLTIGTSSSTASASVTLRVPSQQPSAPVFTDTTATGEVTSASTSATTSADAPAASAAMTVSSTVDTAALVAAVEAWLAKYDVPGVEVAVYQPDAVEWSTASGTDPVSGAAVSTTTHFDIDSITKTFTAALVWQAIDQGLIDPDAPIGQLDALPSFPYTQLTVRELLAHTTGLVNYRDTAQYQSNPAAIDTPAKALAVSAVQPLQWAPGTRVGYSSSNYLVLGFVLEQVTGRSYTELVSALIAHAGLGDVPIAPSAPGLPNFSTAGLEPTAAQLARWGVALLGDNVAELSDTSVRAMETIDPVTGLGSGVWGFCPCTLVDGEAHYAAYGHAGGNTMLQYFPSANMAIVVNVTDSLWDPGERYGQVLELITTLRALAVSPTS
ncbi:MAG TPA: serine hydrolase [Acidimicrobiales bacterium]|jgi:CubicO group peptidase (beta-lactamase class C family)|nr:serine hydrolase [Acidimicrobiales bacterium]